MKKIIFIKFFILLIFVNGCGYTPIFSNKNINFTIVGLELTGNNKLNKILNNKFNIYDDLNSENYKQALSNLKRMSQKQGIDRVMDKYELLIIFNELT